LEIYADKEIRRSELVTLRQYVCTLSAINVQRFVINYFWTKGWGSTKLHGELITTLGDDAYHLSQIKTWLQRFKNGDLSSKDHSRPGRPVLILGSQLEAFLFYGKVANSISYILSTPGSPFWVHMDNSACHNNESKVASRFEQHHIFRLPHRPYSPDISPCGFWLFGLLKGIMKDREFHSHEEIEEAITVA
jgi:hypothetical protein